MCEGRFVTALRGLGFDVISALEVGNLTISDSEQLAFAAAQGRVIVTANGDDFSQIQGEWGRSGRSHPGIVVRKQRQGTPEALAMELFLLAGRFESGIADGIVHL